MLIIPQFRMGRRAAGGATPITVIASDDGTTSANAGTPSAGELLIFVESVTSLIATPPAGFTLAASSDNFAHQGSSGHTYVYTKTAVGSEGTITSGGTPNACWLARLSHGTLSSSNNYDAGGNANSIAAGSSALNPPAGSLMIATVGTSGTTGGSLAASNSFTVATPASLRGFVATRYYATAGTAQNCTLSWTTARRNSSTLILVSP